MAIRISTDGEFVEVTLPTETGALLQELQTYVGGYIEAFYMRDGRVMMLNEDGKGLELPINYAATFLAHMNGLSPGDCIVGNVIVGNRAEFGD